MKIQDMVGIPVELRRLLSGLTGAMSGDILLKITPTTASSSATAVNAAIAGTAKKYVRTVLVDLVDSDGEIHKWFNGSFAIAGSESTAGNGTAATAANTVELVDGSGSMGLEYIGAWASGVKQIETATAVGTITKAGDATVVVTAAGMAGTPKTIAVPVLIDDDANAIALAIRTALAADTAVAAKFVVSGSDAAIVLTAKAVGANDSSLNISIDNGTCEGITTAGSSANTAAGVAADTATVTVTGAKILGYTVAGVTSVDTLGV